jgi:DNA-binding transcriptional MerR regulator
MASALKQKRAETQTTIPDRLYFKIGDVARICGVEPYVLRFWESQFPQLKPNKSGTGQRLYRRRDVEVTLEIKRLVHGEGYTLAGARNALGTGNKSRDTQSSLPLPQESPAAPRNDLAATVGRVRSELREIAAMLAAPGPSPAHTAPTRRRRTVTPIASSEALFPLEPL